MEKHNNTGLNWRYKHYDHDNHGSVAFITEYEALRFIFEDYYARFDKIRNALELKDSWPWGIGPDLKNNFPEVTRYVSINRGGMRSVVLANGEVFFEEDKVFYASEDFFRVFSFPLVDDLPITLVGS